MTSCPRTLRGDNTASMGLYMPCLTALIGSLIAWMGPMISAMATSPAIRCSLAPFVSAPADRAETTATDPIGTADKRSAPTLIARPVGVSISQVSAVPATATGVKNAPPI